MRLVRKALLCILILWTLFIVLGFSTSPFDPGSFQALLIFGVLPWLPVWAVSSHRKKKSQKSGHTSTDLAPSVSSIEANPPAVDPLSPAPSPAATASPKLASSAPMETQSSATGMSDDAYQGFRQLVKMALSNGLVEHDEAAYLYTYLRKEGGLQDSRTRHLVIVLAATLKDGIFDEDEAEDMRVLLSEFADADLFSLPQKKKVSSPRKTRKSKAKKVKERVRPVLGDLIEGSTYDLTYCDADGNFSERRVHVREIAFNKFGNEIVKGRCQLAKATRSFRRDRIISAIDVATGEICA